MANLSQYKVLVTDLLPQVDKEKILAEVVNIKTPASPLPPNYTVKWLDHYARVAVIAFRGVEVLLLFKRMTSELGVTPIEVAPRVHLKNENEAWIQYKLIDLYTAGPFSERIKDLELKVKEKEGLLTALRMELDVVSGELQKYLVKVNKKANKVPVKIPPLYCSVEINEFLAKIKAIKMGAKLHQHFLNSQGYNSKLVHVYSVKRADWEEPEIVLPVKSKKKFNIKATKLDKLIKKATLHKEKIPYIPKVVVNKKKKGKKP